MPALPRDPRPLRALFLDFNAYFASVEQQEEPALRGRPVAVAAVMADSSAVIAASYEAKAFGVKTGTRIGDAKEMCPGIEVVPARAPLYVHYHRRLLDAADSVLPVEKVCSIDEMSFRLIGTEREPDRARELARRMKEAIADQVGPCMTCSIGIAPNAFLAKLATDLEKPNGLVLLRAEDLPGPLLRFGLTDFTGINRRMAARLQAAGIFSAADLFAADLRDLGRAFGSVIGERWWYLLRGYDLKSEETSRRSLGHSHVLPPQLRHEEGAREVMKRLAAKACARLRVHRLWTSEISLSVRGTRGRWNAFVRVSPTQDTVRVIEELDKLYAQRDRDVPHTIGVTFTQLHEETGITPSLFDQGPDRTRLHSAVDELNQRFGKNTIMNAGFFHARDTASEKIAFQKTELFREGRGDNEWVSSRTGDQNHLNRDKGSESSA